jgi:hypothetical protein
LQDQLDCCDVRNVDDDDNNNNNNNRFNEVIVKRKEDIAFTNV